MLALKINDVKGFMNRLLIGETFDQFPMAEASVTTFNTFSIDGLINKEFFDTDTQDILTQNKTIYSAWREIKPFCFSIIRGKRTPLQFKIVFQLSPEQFFSIFEEKESDLFSAVSSFSLIIQYKNNTLLCTTGISQIYFFMDKRAEQFWDVSVHNFFRGLGIDCESL